MKRGLLAIVGIVLVAGGIAALSALYVVDEREQVIVLQFGNPKRIVVDPGLYVKLPFVQNIVRYDKRTLSLDPGPRQIPLADQRRVNVDVYVRYRIVDPLLFFQRVRSERTFDDRAVAIVESELRNVVGRAQLSNLLSERRDETVSQIRQRVTEQVVTFGTEIVDFRIGRVDLPQETSQAVYNRMRSERERLAREFRAVGEEQSRTIRALADRTAVRTVAEADRDSQAIQGKGEGQRNEILGLAFSADVSFFEFYKSLQAYEQAFKNDGTTSMVLSPDSDFFRYFNNLPSISQIPR